MEKHRLDESEVKVKLSICGQCDGIVRVAIEHLMLPSSKKDFFKEVVKYNLSVKSKPLIEYKNDCQKWCECK